MKKLFIITQLLLASFAWAGTPADDVMVKSLQDRFTSAKSPTESDLNIGRKWTCYTYDTKRGSTDVSYDQHITFAKFDGIIIAKGVLDVTPREGEALPKSFVFTKVGLVSTMPSGYPGIIAYNTIRVDAEGNLLAEWSIKATTPEAKDPVEKSGYPLGVTYPRTFATGYSLCAKDSVR